MTSLTISLLSPIFFILLLAYREVSHRKKLKNALAQSEARLRGLFEFNIIGILSGDYEGRILEANHAFLRMLGYAPEEKLSGLSWDEITPEEYREVDHLALEELRTTGRCAPWEKQFLKKDGSRIPVVAGLAHLEKTQKDYVCFVMDITAHKNAETEIRRLLKELVLTNQELTSFAYVVSHDLKAPLRGIAQLAEWLEMDYTEKIDDSGKEKLRMLRSRVKRMHGLIEGILQYSRLGRAREEKKEVDLNITLSEVVETLHPPEHIQILLEGPFPTLSCEKVRIEQVFLNLLSNAIKFLDKPQGVIRIGCADKENFWSFFVSDNGPGIDEKYFEKIFQIFQTLKPRDEFESTGIGLTLVKRIVENYGGKIWLESKIGEGTTFHFTLPKVLPS